MNTITDGTFSLSPQQKRLWTLQNHTQIFRAQVTCLLEGELEVARLWEAVRTVISRHEVFRIRLKTVPGLKYPVQRISTELIWRDADMSDYLFEQYDDQIAPENGLPLRLNLLPVDRRRHLLLVSAPSLCADCVTLRNFCREVAASYGGAADMVDSESPLQYADYGSWRNDLANQKDELSEEALAYWRYHSNCQTILENRLPGHSPGSMGKLSIGCVPFRLEAAVAAKLASLADREKTALDVVLLACWASLLHRLTDWPKIQVGVVVDGRPYDELLGGMGPYAQVVPLLIPCSGKTGFSTLLRETGDRIEQARLWQNYYQWPERSDGQTSYHIFGYSFSAPPETYNAAGIAFTIRTIGAMTDRFELQLHCRQDDECIDACFVYDSASFTPDQVEELARRWEVLCRAVAHYPNQQVGQLSVLTAEDEQHLLVDWNQTEDNSVPLSCIHRCFEEQVARTPDAVAVVSAGNKLTYRQLDDQATELARRLRAAGVGLETPVCLFLGRSVELVVGLLAILKADGAYVPLDTAYPVKERIAHIMRETEAPVILTHARLREYVPEGLAQVICLDESMPSDPEVHELARAAGPESLAYIIYTSGSTGKPKGVMVQHRSVVNLWQALRKTVYRSVEPGALKVTLNAPVSFDASVKQLLVLLEGHALHILPEEVRGDPQAFVNYIREHKIDVLDCTPSHLSALVDGGVAEDGGHAPSLALIGGEAISDSMWAKLAASRATRFYNVYGPTECTVDSTAVQIVPGRVSIGVPLTNVKAYVLDWKLKLQPPGAPGELCISGAGLARGYWGRPELTAERFIPDPFSSQPGQRLYRTGDLARHLPDGSIEYLGRIDQQVKLRGFRVELGEISGALLEHPQVREAVVVVWQDGTNVRLVAYIVSAGITSPSSGELRSFLESRLPEYMIPLAYVTLDALPVTAHGKLDRSALPDPEPLHPERGADFRAPSTEIEMKLARIWSSVLGVEQVGVRDNFFELGGHSLLAMQMIARVRKEFATDIVLPKVFQLPTIEALAEFVEEHLHSGPHATIPALPRAMA